MILNKVAGIGDDYLSTRHGPCPVCDGGPSTDRFRCFDDWRETGGMVCNRCGKKADGFEVIRWTNGCGFPESVKQVGEFLGLNPNPKQDPKKKQNSDIDNLEFVGWSDALAAIWCMRKKLALDEVKKLSPKLARYRTRYSVIAFPIQKVDGSLAGWTIYQATDGTLPERYDKKTKTTSWTKVKNLKYKD